MFFLSWANCRRKFHLHEFGSCIRKTFCNEVYWLVLSNGIVLVPGYRWIKRPQFRLLAQAVFQLTVGAKESSSECSHLIPLSAEAVLDCEPVALKNGQGHFVHSNSK